MSNGAKTKPVLVLVLFGALGVGALAWYVKADPKAAHVPQEISDHPSSSPSVEVTRGHRRHRSKPAESSDDQDDSGAQPTSKVSAVEFGGEKIEVPQGRDPHQYLAELIVKDVKLEGVRVLGVDVRNGVAVVNFSDDIDSGMGSSQEGQFMQDLKVGYAQFPEVQKIEIDKEGQPLEELGHIDLSDPITVTHPGAPTPKPPTP